MEARTPNNWLAAEGEGQRRHFLSERDEFLVDKEACYRTMAAFIARRFPGDSPLDIIDLGCGDGALGGYLAASRKGVSLTLMDGSEPMLEAARKALPGAAIVHATFEEWIEEPPGLSEFDAAVSSMAIHHLPHPLKERLYSKVFCGLRAGGVFLNYDVVRPESPESEEFQFAMWSSWANDRAAARGSPAGKHDGLPAVYKAKAENKPSGLEDNLSALRCAGFRDAECLKKNGIFVLLAGTKF
jgi:tRNA (cmo5U34)-methyltransferase